MLTCSYNPFRPYSAPEIGIKLHGKQRTHVMNEFHPFPRETKTHTTPSSPLPVEAQVTIVWVCPFKEINHPEIDQLVVVWVLFLAFVFIVSYAVCCSCSAWLR